MEKNIVFYFTGTGNSLVAALTIVDALDNGELAFIPSWNRASALEGYDRIGIVCPIYSGGLPNVVQRFLEGLDLSKSPDAYLFLVATKGGTPENASFHANRILSNHGKSLDAYYSVNMGRNYIVFYNPSRPSEKRQSRNDCRLEDIARSIQTKKREGVAPRRIAVLDIAGERLRSRYADMDRGYVVSDACIGCGICAKVCPVENITMTSRGPSFLHQCEQCVACISVCPKAALNYRDKTQKRRRYLNPRIRVKDLIRR